MRQPLSLNSARDFACWSKSTRRTRRPGARNKSSAISALPEVPPRRHEAHLFRLQCEHSDCARSGGGDAPFPNLQPIGVIHSPHKEAIGTPVQASLAVGIESTVEVFPQFTAGLKELEGFERIWLVYWFDRAKETQLIVTPYLDAAPT